MWVSARLGGCRIDGINGVRELRPRRADTVKCCERIPIRANLVINTDADQIIVAEVGTASAGGLPPIRYQSGGLDEKPIRTLVGNILEGGEMAFRDRARRLRIALKR